MNKIKTVFQRSSQKQRVIQDRRPQQFVKRHSSVTATTTTPPQYPSSGDNDPPAIGFEDLSEVEKPAYQSWWRDLDPFDLKKINNQTVLKFLNGCSLQDNKLEQILVLFETAGDGLNKLQFFAMLRLIAHAQNGRKISRALVYLGAPIPHFHCNAIDVLIKSDMTPRRLQENNSSDDENSQENELEIMPNTMKLSQQRKSWWGHENQQQIESRRSSVGPFTAHTLIPPTTRYISEPDTPTTSLGQDYFCSKPSIHHIPSHVTTTIFNNTPNIQQQQWPQMSQQQACRESFLLASEADSNNMIRPVFASTMTATATITPVTPNIIQLEEKQQYTHNRSRSAGNPSDFNYSNPYELPCSHTPAAEEQLHSTRSSLSLHELNTGQTLLLTQKFVYQSPSIRNQELSCANPFNLTHDEPPSTSPFGDENHSDEDNDDQQRINNKPNTSCIPPPPVPTQSTKPAFPKYTRTNSFLIRRSQSTAVVDCKESFNKHQRHKSASATHSIF
ncbi:hypothetical protein [Parasitella parasitica]|uniref:EH domain-containing protein n=1 Tax=Parasitella parasitica TaxID=35722 RepID=A0A0B7NL10_9FUNG|nr:hypothetical protein [Parasitella parasitica]